MSSATGAACGSWSCTSSRIAPLPDGLFGDTVALRNSQAGSLLAWIAARIFGVVVACLCKEIRACSYPVLNLAQDRPCHEQGKSGRGSM